MTKISRILSVYLFGIILICETGCYVKKDSSNNKSTSKTYIQIILGSTREGRISNKIGNLLKSFADKRNDIKTEIIDLKDYNLPFLYSPIAPADVEEITDPKIKKWSDKIKSANAYIIITPEYNSGYPGVLKNALDLIYKEWNNKHVAIVSYSGGSSGGMSVTNQLKQVLKAFKMIPVSTSINIPNSWKTFDAKGNFVDNNIESKFNEIIDQIIGK